MYCSHELDTDTRMLGGLSQAHTVQLTLLPLSSVPVLLLSFFLSVAFVVTGLFSAEPHPWVLYRRWSLRSTFAICLHA